MLKAVEAVNGEIAKALIDAKVSVTDQKAIDDLLIKLDGTPNKARLGANAILGVSIAAAKAGAGEKGIPFYEHLAGLSNVGKPYILPAP